MTALMFAIPVALTLIGCGDPLGKDGLEEATAGSSMVEGEFSAEATICPGSNKVYGIDVSLSGDHQLGSGQSSGQAVCDHPRERWRRVLDRSLRPTGRTPKRRV